MWPLVLSPNALREDIRFAVGQVNQNDLRVSRCENLLAIGLHFDLVIATGLGSQKLPVFVARMHAKELPVFSFARLDKEIAVKKPSAKISGQKSAARSSRFEVVDIVTIGRFSHLALGRCAIGIIGLTAFDVVEDFPRVG